MKYSISINMASRSLSHIFRLQDNRIGTGATTLSGGERFIRSPNTNRRMVLPNHVSDFEWQNDKVIVEPNINKLTDPNANWARSNIRHITKKDRTYMAVPTFDPVTHKKIVRRD